MVAPKLAQLIAVLYSKTMEERLDWTRGDSPVSFLLSTAHSTVEISAYGDPVRQCKLRLFNGSGELIETFSTGREASDEEIGIQGLSAFDALEAIHNGARRKALGVDQALEDMLAEFRSV